MHTQHLESVICPWCLEKFEIDPTLGAEPYECPNSDCGEACSIGALRHPSFHPQAVQISHNLTKAAGHHVYRYSLAYAYGPDDVASGTLVNIGDKCLVASTGHSIPIHKDRIKLVPKTSPDNVERLPKILRAEKSSGVDVGLIEVEPDTSRLLGMEAMSIDCIADLNSGRHGYRAWLNGYPSAQQVPHYGEHGVLGFCALCVSCEPVDPFAWACAEVGKIDDEPGELCENMHTLIYYNTFDKVYSCLDDVPTVEAMIEPYGMSGGGLWQCREATDDDALWSPDKLCLFSIQSSWPGKGKFLKGIQVIHWLQLVVDTYPELQEELYDHFPRLQML